VIEVQGRLDEALVMTGDHTLVLRLGLQGEAAEQVMVRCRSVLHSFAASQGRGALRVVGELGQPIPRGRSGKALRVIGRSL